MKIFIITMDDPVLSKSFISRIIEENRDEIVGLAVSKGDRLKIQRNKSKIGYIFSLFLIMGPVYFITNSFITLNHKIKKYLFKLFPKFFMNPTVAGVAERNGIKTWLIKSPNEQLFLKEISNLGIDLIINQCQNILKRGILEIPRIGVINRHNALLPKNRGRLSPFWVLFNREKESGVSIHFVTEGIDAGDIIVQKRFFVNNRDNFRSIVKKNYQLAGTAMTEALEKIKVGNTSYMKNDSNLATYNSIPTIRQAWEFRKIRLVTGLKTVLTKHLL